MVVWEEEEEEGRSMRKRARMAINLSRSEHALAHGEAAKHSLVTPVSVSFLLWSRHRNRKRQR